MRRPFGKEEGAEEYWERLGLMLFEVVFGHILTPSDRTCLQTLCRRCLQNSPEEALRLVAEGQLHAGSAQEMTFLELHEDSAVLLEDRGLAQFFSSLRELTTSSTVVSQTLSDHPVGAVPMVEDEEAPSSKELQELIATVEARSTGEPTMDAELRKLRNVTFEKRCSARAIKAAAEQASEFALRTNPSLDVSLLVDPKAVLEDFAARTSTNGLEPSVFLATAEPTESTAIVLAGCELEGAALEGGGITVTDSKTSRTSVQLPLSITTHEGVASAGCIGVWICDERTRQPLFEVFFRCFLDADGRELIVLRQPRLVFQRRI